MSKAGAPIGNQNAARRRFRDALNKALAQYTNAHVEARPEYICQQGEALDKIAMNLVHRAVYNDSDAIEEVADRLDGRPAQAITGGEEGDNPISVLQKIVRVVVDSPNAHAPKPGAT